jgi:peptidoglycan/xylan/chitin deacetylase (PgdA/CDA1 family)
MTSISHLAVILAAVLLTAAGSVPQPGNPAVREIAVTIDDLPTVSDLGAGVSAAERTTTDLLAALVRHQVPAIGFVNERKLLTNGTLDERRVALLQQWIDAGMELGNHTYSHPDLHSTPLEEFEREILDGEKVTRRLLRAANRDLRYFRHPFLHTGHSKEIRHRLDRFLARHHYRVAPVTIGNADYVFAAAYARSDAATREKIASAYIDYTEAVVEYSEQLSLAIVGRGMRHTLLLHANALNAAAFDALADRLQKRGYRFITLDRALEDPAYQLPDEYYGPAGMTWLHRWALTEGRRGAIAGEPRLPDWIAAAAK